MFQRALFIEFNVIKRKMSYFIYLFDYLMTIRIYTIFKCNQQRSYREPRMHDQSFHRMVLVEKLRPEESIQHTHLV